MVDLTDIIMEENLDLKDTIKKIGQPSFFFSYSSVSPEIQCPLDIETWNKAAALDLATSKAVTDLRQYINSDLGFSDLKMCFFI